MRQEINLITQELRPSKQFLSFTCSSFGVVAFSLLMVLYIYYQYHTIDTINNNLAHLQEQIDAIVVPPVDNSQLVAYKNKIAHLERRLAKKQHLVASYTQLADAEKLGFSAYFLQIAQFSNANISIDHIRVFEGGRYLVFSGYSVDPQSIPEYMNILKKQPLFSDTLFGELNIERVEGSNVMKFFLKDNSSQYQITPSKGA